MVNTDINELLQNGYWSTSRARSPDSRLLGSNAPSSQSSYVDVTTPRFLSRSRPPVPTVEDEVVAIAKEHGSQPSFYPDEVQKDGDVGQVPIFIQVHEYNPERRWLHVKTSPDSTDSSQKTLPRRDKSRDPAPKPEPEPEPTPYEANTSRRRPPNDEEIEKKRDTGSTREKRRSKLDHLPAIVTDVDPQPRSPEKRAKSTARSEKGNDDYFSPRISSRLQNENTLSPDVIEHASKGRDRGYYHGGASPYDQERNRSAHTSAKYEKSPRDDRRYRDKNTISDIPPSPPRHKRRSTADLPQQLRSPSKVDREKGRQYKEYKEPKSPGVDRNSFSRQERDTASQVSVGSRGKRGSPTTSEYYYSSDEDGRRKIHAHRRYESETKAYLGAPAEIRPNDRQKSRASSPLPSPRTSQVYEKEYITSNSRSSTFPKDIRFTRNEQRTQPPLSRTSTGKSILNASAPIAIPAVAAAAAIAAVNSSSPPPSYRQSSVRPPSRAGSLQSDPRSSVPKLSSSPQRQARQPIESSPLREASRLELAQISSKRYFDEVQASRLPDMQYCPRRKPVAGCVDWLTLPRCDNFNICPSCYEAAFSNTEFAHHFVPAPFRSVERPIACDLGTSRFYHIAYYLIVSKYRMPDLLLFRSIADIGAKGTPCAGHRETSRMWYSVKDIRLACPVESFNVCPTCAKTVEQLLPNLTGIFIPMDSPAQSTRGVCAMHQENEKRFLYYFDVLEAASDKALSSRSPPDVQALADRLHDLAEAEIPPCKRGEPVSDRKWHTMLSLPDFTVCEKCFGEVVWPMIKKDNSSMAANFLQEPELRPVAACQLYSSRMRQIFADAVAQSDIRYLANRLREREDKEREYHARVVGLNKEILGEAMVQMECRRAQQEWAKWE